MDVGLTVLEWDAFDREVDSLVEEIDNLEYESADYDFHLEQKISRLEEIESIVDRSIAIKKARRPSLRLV